MTELSGTFEGVGLPAIVRFLSGLKKTGCLSIAYDNWRGHVFFDLGRVTGASLGSRQGLTALDALVQALPSASFAFEATSRVGGEATISLSAEALQAHLDELVVQTANGTFRLPSFEAVPALVPQEHLEGEGEPLPFDRGMLQTLLVVDGKRTVRQIVAQRGSVDALWQLGNLAEVGLVALSSTRAKTAPQVIAPSAGASSPVAPLAAQPSAGASEPAEPTPARPFALDVAPDDATPHCPKLGFDDDATNSFGRPTRLHRCFAAAAPLPLSLDQQRELCLSDQFGTCPRLTMGTSVPPAREPQTARRDSAVRPPASRRPEPDGDDSRIVRLPFITRANAVERGAVADRQAVGGSEPTRFRPAGGSVRDGGVPPPTPLRTRLERTSGTSSTSAIAEGQAAVADAPRAPEPKSTRPALLAAAAEPRLGGIPVGILAGGAVVLVVLGVVAYLLLPFLGGLFVDDSVDTSTLPNTSAVAAGTPIAQVTGARATLAARATAGADAGASTNDSVSAQAGPPAASAATALPAPTLPPEPGQAAPVQPPGNPLLDEHFTSNERQWPSTAAGTASLTNGSYRLAPRQAGQFVAVGAPIAGVPNDVVVSATFRKLSGPPGGGYGIIVRDQASTPEDGTSQDGHYYVLEVGDKGEIGMWRRDGDHWVDLLAWQPSPVVKAGTAPNEMSVRAVGNRLSLSVNGTQAATKIDDTFSSGGVGLFAGGDGNQVAVDHFSVQTP